MKKILEGINLFFFAASFSLWPRIIRATNAMETSEDIRLLNYEYFLAHNQGV